MNNKFLYEANAQLLLRRLSEKYREPLRLSTIPMQEWISLRNRGFDLVWLMGVWQRSAGARVEALSHPALRQEYDVALPGWTDDDVAGSPYAISGYTLDTTLDDHANLAILKSKLNDCGLGLILDFIPNHVALDHPWTVSHPDRFIQGREDAIRAHPDWFYKSAGGIYLAHGRDLYFPPWTDTAQLNHFSPNLRKALIDELKEISRFADGVRCDMAMLALNDVFMRVWGETMKDVPKPETDFWSEAIACVTCEQSEFLFIAEAYWGLERTLQDMGFQFTYDKILYDKLRVPDVADIGHYITTNASNLQHSVHFIENHDESRAKESFGRDRSMAAMVVSATIPGLCLIHDGQREGRCTRTPVQLLRETEVADDPEIAQFYDRLTIACSVPALLYGEWLFIEPVQSQEDSISYRNILSWCWDSYEDFVVVAVNYAPERSEALLPISLPSYISDSIQLVDMFTGEPYFGDREEVRKRGLYVDLPAYKSYFFRILRS